MGNSCVPQSNKLDDYNVGDKTHKIVASQIELEATLRIALRVKVAHFTPSSFPLCPVIDSSLNKICESSWHMIVGNGVVDEYGGTISGMTMFYNEFYERLDAIDTNGKFDAVLSRYSFTENKIAAKGAIIIRIINFMLKIESNNRQTQLMLYMLGKSHAQRSIRPWQYSILIQCLLLTISSRLGTAASNHIMDAWVNLSAFVLQSMLPPAIKNQIVENEFNINTSSEFAVGKVHDEVEALEEISEMRRKMRLGQGGGGSVEGGGGSEERIAELTRARRGSGGVTAAAAAGGAGGAARTTVTGGGGGGGGGVKAKMMSGSFGSSDDDKDYKTRNSNTNSNNNNHDQDEDDSDCPERGRSLSVTSASTSGAWLPGIGECRSLEGDEDDHVNAFDDSDDGNDTNTVVMHPTLTSSAAPTYSRLRPRVLPEPKL